MGLVDDPIIRKLFEQLGVNAVPLGVPDVLPSLQTGLINSLLRLAAVDAGAAVVHKVKYMTAMHLTQAIGATVMAKKEYDKLGPSCRRSDGRLQRTSRPSAQAVRDENASRCGDEGERLTVVESPKEMIAAFEEQAKAIRPKLEPSVYSHDFREKVEKLVAEFRAKK